MRFTVNVSFGIISLMALVLPTQAQQKKLDEPVTAILNNASEFDQDLRLFSADPLPLGKSMVEVQLGGVRMKLFVYKPNDFRDGPMLMVFHGVLRNAEEYRDHSISMGDRLGAMIVAPLFDEQTFSIPAYQHGGIVVDGKANSPEKRTGQYVNQIANAIRKREGRADMPYSLIGHSGGGQFLNRLAAFVPTEAQRIVVANPGTYTFPTLTAQFPYGFGGLPPELQSDEVLKAYLSQPVTIYLGAKDIERDEHLDIRPAADAQGQFRFERGQNVFETAKKIANEKQWPFGWKLVVAQETGHDHEKMFNHEACAEALEWNSEK